LFIGSKVLMPFTFIPHETQTKAAPAINELIILLFTL